ncbi:hypothetical protein M422DRAFT_781304 [Sphaerobolus stellatus SS14]|uniref:Uncharacterized protein n=1 Tax=Sphaerobolus stellatus (strain SS14) TaxID=990650 RepID=A0A0C9U6T8_SPHS4|nr:hypothetical protein M422DRAFT_781304 [Sphaerobolus stellatus SS14]
MLLSTLSADTDGKIVVASHVATGFGSTDGRRWGRSKLFIAAVDINVTYWYELAQLRQIRQTLQDQYFEKEGNVIQAASILATEIGNMWATPVSPTSSIGTTLGTAAHMSSSLGDAGSREVM